MHRCVHRDTWGEAVYNTVDKNGGGNDVIGVVDIVRDDQTECSVGFWHIDPF